MEDESIKLFFSYSHKDEGLRDELVNHLCILTRQGIISSWHDRKILPGTEWHHHIHGHLETADIILLLLSADFIASDYCLDTEVDIALRRHESGEACVVPIVLRPVDWTGAKFAKLQVLPTHGRPITMWADRDEAFLDVAQGIRKLADHLRARRRQKFEEKQRVSAQYKQKVEEILSSSSGCISVIARDTLNELCEKLKLTTEEAQTIEAHAFEPYKIYEANLEKYKHTLLKVIDQHPFSEEIKRELEYRQRDLGIKSEDVERIEQPLLAAVKAESANKLSRDQQEFSNTVQAHDPLDQDVRHGRQSSQRSLVASVACAMGLHKWSDWVYTKDAECHQVRKCQRCGKGTNRIEHIWGDPRYKSAADCLQVHICARCAKSENVATVHQWGQWLYDVDGKCDMTRTCEKCNKKEHKIEHPWGDLVYERKGNCTASRECQRCRERKDRHTVHQWTAWGGASYKHEERVCKRCGEKETRQPCTGCEQGTTTCMGCNGRGYNIQLSVAPGVGGSIGSGMVTSLCGVCQGSGVIVSDHRESNS